MHSFANYQHPYTIHPDFCTRAAYFCMEFGIHQPLKIYSGGLGYLAGSHLRSAYELRQHLIGIGILWKFGYYDQSRHADQSLEVSFLEKDYHFLTDTGIRFEISVHRHPVKVRVWYLPPHVFGTAPLFLLSTDLPENDYLARTISHRLYDNNTEAKIAQSILLGVGGAKLLDLLGFAPEVYHFNEAHALPAAFYLYEQLGSLEAVRDRVVFTTHTPVEAGNEKHDIHLLERMGFFGNLSLDVVRQISGTYDTIFNHTLVALRMARLANGVSQMHGDVANEMWSGNDAICPITAITNAQNQNYWQDPALRAASHTGDIAALVDRKRELKRQLFEIVADQTGKIFDPDVLTIVWARRFAGYKRADLITRDRARFDAIVRNAHRPVQIIWAGKPYPMDYEAIAMFNQLIYLTKSYPNCAVLTGYELTLSKQLKCGSDVWLNTPRVTREASGTSGMTAAMNGSVNCSTYDGWIPEFAQHGNNAFVIPTADLTASYFDQDTCDATNLLNVLAHDIIPTYYDRPAEWWAIVQRSMNTVVPFFDSNRMAREYYERLYAVEVGAEV